MILFTKTCARDAERLLFQALAVRRRFPLATHVVLVEAAEHARLHTDTWRTGGARIFTVEAVMPEAMRIENPELRQQYCKIMAPIVFGEDTFQIDSDMCPKPRRVDDPTTWLPLDAIWRSSHVYDGQPPRPRWDFVDSPKAFKSAIEQWTDTYAWLFNIAVDDTNYLYMQSQNGWVITRELVAGFLARAQQLYAGPFVERVLEAERTGRKFSEYQLLGRFAHKSDHHNTYSFRQLWDLADAPWQRARDQMSPFYHFSSKEPLTDEQRVLLAEAAGTRGVFYRG